MSEPTAKAASTMTVDLQHQVGGDDAPRYLLVIDSASSRRIDLPRNGSLIVGRSPEADIRVEARGASRLHARVIVSNGEVQISDLNSHNGTLVNGDRLAGSRALCSGDVVMVGDTILTLWREPQAVGLSAVDLGRQCPACGTGVLSSDARFCHRCGTALG